MPIFRCVECSSSIQIDPNAMPYAGEFTCSGCRTSMDLRLDYNLGTSAQRSSPRLDGIKGVRERLEPIEVESLREAAAAFSVRAYTASELMALRAVEHVMRRVLDQPKKTFGALLLVLQGDPRFKGLHGVLDYFRAIRNGAAHPDKTPSREEAETTLGMSQRLITEILNRA